MVMYQKLERDRATGRQDQAKNELSNKRLKCQLTDVLLVDSFYVARQLAKWEEKFQKQMSK